MQVSSAYSNSYNPYQNSSAQNTKTVGLNEDTQETSDTSEKTSQNTEDLTTEEVQEVSELQARDTEVRTHEAAHIAASGGLAMGGASFTYQKGPDGMQYAIGGEVNIDTSEGKTPEETISKAQTIRAAALAPADPSGQDLKVAASATSMETSARAELAQQKMEEAEEAYKSNQGEEEDPNTQNTKTIDLSA